MYIHVFDKFIDVFFWRSDRIKVQYTYDFADDEEITGKLPTMIRRRLISEYDSWRENRKSYQLSPSQSAHIFISSEV